MKTLLFALLALALGLTVLAQPDPTAPPPIDREKLQLLTSVGMADIIAVVTVNDVKLPAVTAMIGADGNAPSTGMWFENGKRGGNVAEVTLTINEGLKGAVTVGKKVTLSIPVYPLMKNVDGKMTLTGWNIDIKPQEERIVNLQRTQNGYGPGNMGAQAFLAIEKLPAVKAAIAEFPLEVTVLPMDETLYFGKAGKIIVSVKNIGKTAIQLANISLEGFYLAKKMDAYASLQVIPTPGQENGLPTMQKPMALAPDAEASFTLNTLANAPAAWQLFGEESYLQAPMAFRARVMVKIPDADPKKPTYQMYSGGSPWAKITVGYPLPTATTDL